jgi:aryl-alcohol dehydrogenase-like predicted oxidoreductase
MSYGSDTWADWVLNEEKALPLLKAAWDAGIQTWDTADMYSNVFSSDFACSWQGISEELVGKAIKKYNIPREKLVILTKCNFPLLDDPQGGRFKPEEAGSRDYINKKGEPN